MKKIIITIITMLTVAVCLGGCSTAANKNDKLQVVCTIFPQYDWTSQLLGEGYENVDMTLLLDNGIDLHNYQPTAEDIVKISSADLFIYVGGESDAWVDEVLKSAVNKDLKVINMMEVLGDAVREEELVEGMEEEHDHEDAAEHENEDADHKEEEHSDEPEYDEHVWLSIKNAKIICHAITDALKTLRPNDASRFDDNEATYLAQLEQLDEKYQQAADASEHKTVLFADRFPFRYLVDDYGIAYYAAFPGCSAETEASFETIAFLSKKIDELNLKSILVLEGAKHDIADTVIQSTTKKDQTIVVMNSIQSITSDDVKNGSNYLSIMEKNLEALKTALQ